MGCFLHRGTWIAVLLLLVLSGRAETLQDGEKIYQQNCANCHDNGKGTLFAAGQLKHGDSDDALARSIRDGFAGTEMPPFGRALNETQIRALVVVLHERIAQRVVPVTNLPIDPAEIHHSERHAFRIETIVDQGLEVPWSFVFLPDGDILLTERAGRLRRIHDGRLAPEPVAGIPKVIEQGEGGLMAIALHPDYAHQAWVYLAFTDPGPKDTAMTKIVRGHLRDNRLTDIEPIFSMPVEKYPSGYTLFGCRLEFDGGFLFFSIGERGMTGAAQQLDTPYGKIHRVLADGKIPPDNPFVATSGAWPSVWAYGNRNPQGLAFDPRTHALWESEHGPRGGDELNLIERGKNYGWPVITYGINYDGTAVTEKTAADGMEQPVRHWTPSIATSQIAFYTGDRFPRWKYNLFLGSLAAQRFFRFEIDGRNLVHEEEIFQHLGRIRDIKTGPDGLLYVALEQIGNVSGRLVRLVPAD